MKLTSVLPQIKAENKIQKSGGAATAKSESNSAVVGSDRVELSSGSREVLKMQELLQEAPEVRADRVDELKRRIDDGSYEVDAHKVAGKMLQSLLSDYGGK